MFTIIVFIILFSIVLTAVICDIEPTDNLKEVKRKIWKTLHGRE